MKRLVNLRFPVLLACAMIAGIAVGYLFVFYHINMFWLIAVVPITAVIFILLLLFTKKITAPVIVVIASALIAAGAVNCYFRLYNFGNSEIIDGQIYSVTATVCDKGESEYGEYIIVKNIVADGKKTDGKAYAYLNDIYGDFCDVGYKVSFSAKFSRNDPFPYGKLNHNAQDNIKFRCTLTSKISAKRGFSLFGSVRSHIRETLFNNLDKDTSAVAYALLTGNTQDVESGVLTTFRNGGIAHVFAVSGLHIGIVFGIISFICKKAKANKYLAAALCILPIFFYAGVCGFTLSSVRAAIMCTVAVIARLFHKKSDSLNSLAIAVIIILFISPLSLFSVGFQLSVCAVGGILILSKRIVSPFKKLPKKLTSAVGISLSAQAGTLPVMLANFGYLSGAGLILNIVIVPLLSVIFVITFLGVLFCALISAAAPYVLPVAALSLKAVLSFLVGAGFEKAIISGFGAGAFLPIYFLGLFLVSDKFNLKRLHRIIAGVTSAAVLLVYVLCRTYLPANGYKIVASGNYYGGEVLIKSNKGNVLIVTEGVTSNYTLTFLNEYYATDISAVIILGGEDCVLSYGNLGIKCDGVYVFYQHLNLQPYKNVEVKYESEFSVGGVNFTFGDGYSVLADFGGIDIAVCAGSYCPFESCDLLIANDGNINCQSKFNAYFNARGYKYNTYDYGDLTFKISGRALYSTDGYAKRAYVK
ncbi:MAG: ComEC/Rec2 family competence protein [Clostridia bacterium]|nr:ComEC/Rec2 family competence protein [Clostridia bacterium]